MVASIEEINALEEWLAKVKLPMRLHLNSAEKINDLPAYITRVINNLKDLAITDTVLRPRYDDLLRIKFLLEKELV
jgi:hypothetical protein